MIYFTSDLHLGHNRDFIYKTRGFSSVEAMNEGLIEKFNIMVNKDDEVYILGDLIVGGDLNEGVKLLNRLNGYKYVIAGNHDTQNRIEAYMTRVNNMEFVGWGMPLRYKKYHFFLSHYPTITTNFDKDKPLKQQVINLCAHSHYKNRFKDMTRGLIYHVECDAHNCSPVSIEKILTDIKFFISMDKNDQISLCEKEIY